jgi:hypothetical protein
MMAKTIRTDEQLEMQSSSYGLWMHISAAVVILGVILEIYIAYENPPYGLGLQRWGSLIADIMIATGVGGEVLFGAIDSRCQSELRIRSNQKLGEALLQAGKAHERAAANELEADQLRKELAPRELSQQQYETLLTLRDKVEAVGIRPFPDSESVNFARQIAKTLERAEITTYLYDPQLGMTWTGIYIVLPKAPVDYRLEPLYAAFTSAGFHIGCGARQEHPLIGLPTDIPIIMVGEKRGLPRSSPPYVFTLPRKTDSDGKIV